MKRIMAVCVCMGVMALGAPVWAQQSAGERAVQELEMDAMALEGATSGPGSGTQGERHTRTRSLIKVRQDFIPELVESVNDL
jgi:hypothetical protein